jgi:hypothetical protein
MVGSVDALYAIREGRVIEAWFYPEDPDGALDFFQ